MNKPDVSIIIPSIRPHKLVGVYESILDATKKNNFEIIVVGPYQLPKELESKVNIKFIKDYGSPVRASQLGAIVAEGEVLTSISDDAFMLEDSMDIHLEILRNLGGDPKNILITKYYEGQLENILGKPFLMENREHRSIIGKNISPGHSTQQDRYYKINNAACTRSPHLPEDWWIFNVVYIYRSFFEELGGWDC